jgi:hypothetical protein
MTYRLEDIKVEIPGQSWWRYEDSVECHTGHSSCIFDDTVPTSYHTYYLLVGQTVNLSASLLYVYTLQCPPVYWKISHSLGAGEISANDWVLPSLPF